MRAADRLRRRAAGPHTRRDRPAGWTFPRSQGPGEPLNTAGGELNAGLPAAPVLAVEAAHRLARAPGAGIE